METKAQLTDEATTTNPTITAPELSRIPAVRALLSKGDIDGLCAMYEAQDDSLTGAETAKVIRLVITEMYEAIKGL